AKELLADPRINGLSVLLPWRQLEPEETHYQWQSIDKLLDLCQSANKSLILRISTCGTDNTDNSGDTPKWVYDAGAKFVTFKSGGNERRMPVYWDSTYLAKWSNFINAMGEKYDKNPSVHSIGITGGGVGGGTAIIPEAGDKEQYDALDEKLKKEFGMNGHQLVEHWKYVADLFPRAFKTARLNFDIDPPTPNRAGENLLDEISDYLVYRYGERVYLTRENVSSAKHGFDQYRVLLKFRPDTLTGYQLSSSFPSEDLSKLVKNSLDDGVSFAEVPANLISSKDQAVAAALDQLRAHLGYQLISQKVTLPNDIKSGDPLKAGFSFVNLGAATPMRPSR
ncbi:MAG: beta-galactosidase, partial [Terriglobales bacterium]